MKEFSLREAIRRSLADQRGMAKEKGIELKTEVPQSLPKIRGSSLRLQQVITNLVDNAINYTTEGMVTIRVGEEGNEVKVE